MLVVERHAGESIRIGDDIIIKVVASSNGKLKLGITAPKDVPVHREEVYDAIQHGKDSDHDDRRCN